MIWSIRHLAQESVKGYVKMVRRLSREVNLEDPAAAEAFIYNLKVKNQHKNQLLVAYQHYCRANMIAWKISRFLPVEPYPVKVPTEERINMILGCARPKYAAAYNISKYGLRPDEVAKVSLRDIDFEKRTLTVKTSKLGLPRILQLKLETVDIIREIVCRQRITGLDERIFPNKHKLINKWVKLKHAAYEKFRDPELLKIRLYDLRHWYATTTYLKTGDIFYVQYALGHRNIKSTMVYMQIAKGLIHYSGDYTCKVAQTLDEAVKLVEAGFEYVTEMDGKKIFRKRK